MDKLAQTKTWDYDYTEDPAWQAYRKEYLREADRGTRDTLAAYAGQTGGIPSTAAVGAAQQQGNYYRAQLADKIPELMQQDYSRWIGNRDADRADLNLLQNIEAQRDADSLARQQWDWQKEGDLWNRNYTEQQAAIASAMNRWGTLGYADQGVADVLGVPVGTSTQDAKYQQAQLEAQQWQRQQTERADAYDRAMTWIQMGLMPDDATLAAAGLDKSRAQAAVNQAQGQLAARYAGSSGGSRRSTSSGGGGGGGGNDDGDDRSKGTSSWGPGVDDPTYLGIRRTIYYARQTNNREVALSAMRQFAGQMTEQQYNDLVAYIDQLFAEG
jgi:hypothetical protein